MKGNRQGFLSRSINPPQRRRRSLRRRAEHAARHPHQELSFGLRREGKCERKPSGFPFTFHHPPQRRRRSLRRRAEHAARHPHRERSVFNRIPGPDRFGGPGLCYAGMRNISGRLHGFVQQKPIYIIMYPRLCPDIWKSYGGFVTALLQMARSPCI